jgi:hypothetical protein
VTVTGSAKEAWRQFNSEPVPAFTCTKKMGGESLRSAAQYCRAGIAYFSEFTVVSNLSATMNVSSHQLFDLFGTPVSKNAPQPVTPRSLP